MPEKPNFMDGSIVEEATRFVRKTERAYLADLMHQEPHLDKCGCLKCAQAREQRYIVWKDKFQTEVARIKPSSGLDHEELRDLVKKGKLLKIRARRRGSSETPEDQYLDNHYYGQGDYGSWENDLDTWGNIASGFFPPEEED
ncbi:MAG: hypothetical protein Q7S31_03020 [bacterium]|nr:hypothetical protein [bacterium]